MKSTHRKAAKAKRAGRVQFVTTYGLLDTLFARPDAPMPAEKVRHQLTRMYGGLHGLETDAAPSPDDWRVVSDAVNLMETLVMSMRLAQDPDGLLADAVAALALAGARHLETGAPIRLDGPGIQAVRSVLASYAEVLAALSEREITECHRLTELRIMRINAGHKQAHDVQVVSV